MANRSAGGQAGSAARNWDYGLLTVWQLVQAVANTFV
jgi:hypothetical protein